MGERMWIVPLIGDEARHCGEGGGRRRGCWFAAWWLFCGKFGVGYANMEVRCTALRRNGRLRIKVCILAMRVEDSLWSPGIFVRGEVRVHEFENRPFHI